MMTTLVLTEGIERQLMALAAIKVESGCVLLAKLLRSSDGSIRLLARELIEVPDEAYTRREEQLLLITSDGYVPALAKAEAEGCIPIWVHTHPAAPALPYPSKLDKKVDRQLSDVFRLRADSEYYGALILSPDNDRLIFTGHLDDGTSVRPIDRLVMVADRIKLQFNEAVEVEPMPAMFDRNVRAFGGSVQRILGSLRIGVVGCGGTGSAVAEQLARLGVRDLILADPDAISESNITRVYGSGPGDIGHSKVETLSSHLRRIVPAVKVEAKQAMLTVEEVARSLASTDVIFGCTDDNAGRLILSRMSTFLLIPVVDCGVILTSDDDGTLNGIHGRVTILQPGAACLICRGRIDLARASSEMLTPTERKRLVTEGYAPSLEGIEPAVITFTSAVAAAAVSELLERLTGYGVEPVPTEIILRLHDREISTNIQLPRERHYCHPASGKIGIGLTEPFLEQTWQA